VLMTAISIGPGFGLGGSPAWPPPQLSVRSAKARDLARRQCRSIADVVGGALGASENQRIPTGAWNTILSPVEKPCTAARLGIH
jgi:hypothetical protein